MSKVFIYILDKIVWMLLITALTTQALQIAGFLETPKGLQEMAYSKENEYNIQYIKLYIGSETRGEHKTAARSQLIHSFLNMQSGQGDFFYRKNVYEVIRAVM